MRRHWKRGSRFSRRYWWEDDQYTYASVQGSALGWYVLAYSYDVPDRPFPRLKDAKAWVEKHVKPRRRASRKEGKT